MIMKMKKNNEDIKELNPYRPELEKIEVPKIKLLCKA